MGFWRVLCLSDWVERTHQFRLTPTKDWMILDYHGRCLPKKSSPARESETRWVEFSSEFWDHETGQMGVWKIVFLVLISEGVLSLFFVTFFRSAFFGLKRNVEMVTTKGGTFRHDLVGVLIGIVDDTVVPYWLARRLASPCTSCNPSVFRFTQYNFLPRKPMVSEIEVFLRNRPYSFRTADLSPYCMAQTPNFEQVQQQTMRKFWASFISGAESHDCVALPPRSVSPSSTKRDLVGLIWSSRWLLEPWWLACPLAGDVYWSMEYH